MAKRPVFAANEVAPYYIESTVEFEYFNGFSMAQKRRSIISLHDAYHLLAPSANMLEISSKSESELGVKLSAFNLMIKRNFQIECSVECAFQASKVFENGGPYTDILGKTSREAKRDERLASSGALKSFFYEGQAFGLEPTTYFYNWLYITALCSQPDLSNALAEYDAFTDIEFNPVRSINCQARAAAVFISLKRAGVLEAALKSPASFLKTVYGGR